MSNETKENRKRIAVLIGPMNKKGIVLSNRIFQVFSFHDAETYFGKNSILAKMVHIAFAANQNLNVFCIGTF